MKGLFCWPCLFRPGASQTWTETGYTNMHGFLSDCKKREKASAHLGAHKMWKTFEEGGRFNCTCSVIIICC